MTIYPIVIPTLCRYELFVKCVDSLSKCTLAEQTELVIGLDFPLNKSHEEGWKKIKTYIGAITGFRKLTVFTSDVNLGASKNLHRLIDYVYASYDAVILTEDDNFFSPCFLEFMNNGLNEFRDNPKIISVCGYTAMQYYGVTHDFSAWGVGRWKEKHKGREVEYYYNICHSLKKSYRIFKEYPSLLMMLMVMLKRKERYGDTMRSIDNMMNDTYQLRPALSMVRNLGQDGSGLHSGINPEYLTQQISIEKHFNFSLNAIAIAFKESRKVNKCTFGIGLSRNSFKAVSQLLYYVVKWCIFRTSKKKLS